MGGAWIYCLRVTNTILSFYTGNPNNIFNIIIISNINFVISLPQNELNKKFRLCSREPTIRRIDVGRCVVPQLFNVGAMDNVRTFLYTFRMSEKKSLSTWKLAIVYLLVYLLILIILGILYSTLVITLFNLFSFEIPALVKWLFSFSTIIGAIIISATLTKKWFSANNINKTILYSTLLYFIVELLFVVRDFVVTDINGIPILRDHPSSIIGKAITLAIFYFSSRWLLSRKKI